MFCLKLPFSLSRYFSYSLFLSLFLSHTHSHAHTHTHTPYLSCTNALSLSLSDLRWCSQTGLDPELKKLSGRDSKPASKTSLSTTTTMTSTATTTTIKRRRWFNVVKFKTVLFSGRSKNAISKKNWGCSKLTSTSKFSAENSDVRNFFILPGTLSNIFSKLYQFMEKVLRTDLHLMRPEPDSFLPYLGKGCCEMRQNSAY